MAYDKRLESVKGAKAEHDKIQRSATAARLRAVAEKVKNKKKAKQEIAA